MQNLLHKAKKDHSAQSNPVQNGPLYKIVHFLRKLVPNSDCFSDSSLKSISSLPSAEPVHKPPRQKEFPHLHPDTGTIFLCFVSDTSAIRSNNSHPLRPASAFRPAAPASHMLLQRRHWRKGQDSCCLHAPVHK